MNPSFLKKLILLIASGILSGAILVGCGGGGDSEPAAVEEPMENDGGGEGEGEGEGAGACRFTFTLVQEVSQPSAPADMKVLIISTPCASGADADDQFTTNNGSQNANSECGNNEFRQEYEAAFGVVNTDC